MDSKGGDGAGSEQRFENLATVDRESGFSMMQHLIDEMDRSSQRIDEYNTQEFGGGAKSSHLDKHQIDLLYDEAWKSEDSDAASLKEVPSDFFDKCHGDGCDDAVTSAIAEVSKDFLAGLRASASRANGGDSDDSGSHLSSDTDFKLIKGMPAYARYPETAAGLSDNDWNPYGTESDTNISPRVPSQETPVSRGSGSKLASMTSFNPPLHSTDWNMATPSSLIVSIPNTGARTAGRHNTLDQDFVVSLKPDITADFSTISQVSEQTMGSYIAPPPESAQAYDLNKTMRKDELEGVAANGQSVGIEILQRELDDLKRSHFQPANRCRDLPKDPEDFKTVGGSYMSVMDRAKMVGVPEDIVNGTGKVHGDSFESKGRQQSFSDQGNLSEDDILGRKVKKVLSDTKYLENNQRDKKTMHEVAIDYQSLQKDLQEIQDSLNHNFGSGSASTIVAKNSDRDAHSVVSKITPPSSDNDGEIIPSTTTTPERKNSGRRVWDFHEDLASEQFDTQLRDINTRPASSEAQRSPTEKQPYNSDGDDTRTSGSSDKVDEHHAAADQALAEMSAILRPHPQLAMTTGNGIHSAQDVDIMLSNFRDQRRELESRYQQLSNPGLAEKVFRILTSQDSEAQANGILSNASAQEREDRARFALGLYSGNKELNFSTTDTDNPNTSNQSFLPVDDVRKKLDLSGLSSADGSKLGDKSSFTMPNTKGFSAFDGMTKFLSSQMAKASERTFNHSLEMQIPPQVATCYPLFADHNPNNGTEEDNDGASNLLAGRQYLTADDLATNPEDIHPTATSSPVEPTNVAETKDVGQDRLSSPDDSDSSSGKRKEKYRPYRPPGSKDFYYTESDAASVADSVTTMESTHIGSDDAKGPSLPSAALGSRKDPPDSGGIYAKQKPLGLLPESGTLPTIQEKSICDDRESDPNASSRGSVDRESRRSTERETPTAYNVEAAERGQRSSGRQVSAPVEDGSIRVQARVTASVDGESNYVNRGLAAARRDARWENRLEEHGSDFIAKDTEHYVRSEDRAAEFNELSDLGSVGRYSQSMTRGSSIDARSHDVASKAGRDEPLSLRVSMTYTDDTEAKRVRQTNYEKEDTYGRKTWQEPQRRERDLDDQFKDKWDKFEEQRSNENQGRRPTPMDVSGERQHQATTGSRDFIRSSSPSNIRSHRYSADLGHRGHAYEQAPFTSPPRDARLSPAFHRALSPDLRQAIGRRSPLLSQNIERSLAQAPLDPSARQSRYRDQVEESHRHRTSSPPPTFLARERGQPPRDYARSPPVGGRRSPPPAPRLEQAWAEDRALSPSQHLRLSSPQAQPHVARPRSPVALPQYSEVRSTIPSTLSQEYRPQSPSHTQGYVSPPRQQRSPSPTFGQQRERPESMNQRNLRERHVERTLEHMTSESEDTEVDREPLSRRAKMLKAALPQEQDISPDINALWDRFKALNESNDSSMNSSRIEAVTDLLRNPSQHLISNYLKEREEYRIERQERAEVERERRLREQMAQHGSHAVSHLHSSSEEDLNEGGYGNLLAQKEEERMKRRALKKKKGKTVENGKGEKNKENVPDYLFSIPEDGGSDQSPLKSGSAAVKQQRNRQQHKQQHVIDPNMQKLREKIARQRGKIDKQTLKELQRVEKLKKLEQLLSAKTKNQIGDQTLKEQLAEISSTSTPGSNSSQENNNDGYDDGRDTVTPRSEDSTTAKDSSAEMHAWKAEKERRLKVSQLSELERRKEFVSKEKDRNTNRKPSYLSLQQSKTKVEDSELKLLKLVNKGYLSAAEAYRLALERAQHHESVMDDGDTSNASLSSPDEPSFNGRSHRLYSPYARRDTSSQAHSKHVPKLKQLSPTTYVNADPSFPLQDHFRKGGMSVKTGDAFEKRHEMQSPDNFVFSKGKPMRQSGRSPPPYNRREAALTKLSGSSKYAAAKGSVSPMRVHQLLPHHHHHPQQQRGERFPSRHEASKFGLGKGWVDISQVPTPKGVSWQIPFDTHPSKWTEPAGPHEATNADNRPSHQKKGPTGNKNMTTKSADNEGKRTRKQLPLPDGPAQLEEGEEPLQRWEKQGKNSKAGFWNKSDHPHGIPQEVWEEVVSTDALASKANHWDVDPLMDRVEYILNKQSCVPATEEPFPNMTLQDAFLARKQIFISKCRERQKRIALAREDRHLQECLRLEREAIFAEQDRPVSPNLHAHPVSENLYHPKRRVISKSEMKALTQRRYKTLHEVVNKKEKQRNEAELKLNRLRAKIFNKKVQRDVLRKSTTMRRR